MEEVSELLSGTLKEKAEDPEYFDKPKKPEGGFARLEKKKTKTKRNRVLEEGEDRTNVRIIDV